jgi:orotidine-5'-phosphate decarboxylase
MASTNARLAPEGIGPIGAVVGATDTSPALELAAMRGLFLAPGVGAQGATAADVGRVFSTCPDRVMPSASRSLLEAGPNVAGLRDSAAKLAAELSSALGP